MRRLLLLLLAVIGGLAAALPAPAVAAEPKLAEVKGGKFPERAWVLSLPRHRNLQASDLDVRENGRAVGAVRVVAGDQAGPKTFGVVLAIDASESMHGAAIEQAMVAARAFAKRRRSDQQIGLVLFSRDAVETLPLTTDPDKIQSVLAQTPALSKGTRIYDAGVTAIGMLRKSGVRAGSVIIMSDGADVGSETPAARLAELAHRTRTRLYTVGLASPSFDPSTLSGIAASADGAYSEAGSPEQLKAIYAELGEQLATQYLVTYRSLAPLASDIAVTTEVRGVPGTAVAEYTSPQFPAAIEAPRATNSVWKSLPVLLGAILLVALLAGTATLLALRRPRVTVRDRIMSYTQPRARRESLITDQPEGTVFSRAAEHALRRARWWPRFAERVDLSGMKMSAGQLVVITVMATVMLVWLALAAGRPITAGIVALLPLGVHLFLDSRVARTQRLFNDQLAETLEVVASAMRAGHSFEGGLSVASEDAAEPMRSELRKVVADERLGVPLGEAIAVIARRMECREFDHVGAVVVIQRESGGNTAELLDRTVETLRHRGELRRMVRTLTAQGRAGGFIVSALPVVIALALSLISPGYLDPMVSETAGVVAVVIACCSVVTGWLVIRKVVDIKV
jgi:tight adherence protein B